jgi:hypothetical protein
LHVTVLIRFLKDCFPKGRRGVNDVARMILGISDDTVRRAIRDGERLELLSVNRRPGCKIRVRDVAIAAARQFARPLPPVPWPGLRLALRCPPEGFRTALACWMADAKAFELSCPPDLGVFELPRGLAQLEAVGLVEVARRPGRRPVVTMRSL